MIDVCILNVCFYAVVGEVDVVEERCAASHPTAAHADHDDVVVGDFVLVSDDFELTEQEVERCTGVGGFLLLSDSHPVAGDLIVDTNVNKCLLEVEFL